MNAPACLKCDDSGVVPGNEVFSAMPCRCKTGNPLRSVPHDTMRPARALDDPGFIFGSVKIDAEGMSYAGVKIEDAGRAYRTLIAVLHGVEPMRDDRHVSAPGHDVAVQDLGLMVARLAHALTLHSPNDHLLRGAEMILKRHGMQAGVDYKAISGLPKITWPQPDRRFTIERRDDPHNMSNRHNALNQGRRSSDKREE